MSDELVVVTVTYSPGRHLDRFLATLSHATERPVTVETGTNRLAGTRHATIIQAFEQSLHAPNGGVPDLWDGRAAERIAQVLDQVLHGQTLPRC